MRLLVGYDGSDGGRDALELTRVLATMTGARVLVVTVLPYGPLPVDYSLLGKKDEVAAEPLLAQAREALAGIEVEARAYGGGGPAEVINDLAESEDVDMVVVGSPHRGAVGRAVIGSVAEGLLHGAPCPVVAAPRGYAAERHHRPRTIAVAYDGTPEARAALARAESLAALDTATIRILTVAEPPVALPGVVGYTPQLPPDPAEVAREGVAAVGRGVAAEAWDLTGPAADALAEACEGGVDLLVAGSRRYGPLARVLLGSVSTKLIHKAPCPVLVVPRP